MSDNDRPNEIQRYELVERIAVGGMAEVFRAKTFGFQGFEKQLAVKRILPELASNREFVDRFISEAKIAVTLNHANIVQVLDFSRFGDSLFIAMEFIDGCDLSALLKGYRSQGKILPLAAGLHLAIEILKGLDFAHGRSVVHRDISPANILVSKSGEVKIADFGIAQAADGGSGHTNPFRIMGKWRYMSPEQTRAEPLDAASDLFSTAIVLHEIFSGRRLFDQDEPAEIVDGIRTNPIPRLRDLRPALPERLDEIVQQALNRDRAERGTASQMMLALIELSYAQSLPITAMDLAAEVKDFVAQSPKDSSMPSDSGQLIDDIINSELQHKRPGHQTRLTRVTPAQAEPEPGRFDEAGTGLTFVDGGQGPDGLTQWLVGGAEGGPVEVPGEFNFDIPTVTPAQGIDTNETVPTRLIELIGKPAAALAAKEPARFGSFDPMNADSVDMSQMSIQPRGGLTPRVRRNWPIVVAALLGSALAALLFSFLGSPGDAKAKAVDAGSVLTVATGAVSDAQAALPVDAQAVLPVDAQAALLVDAQAALPVDAQAARVAVNSPVDAAPKPERDIKPKRDRPDPNPDSKIKRVGKTGTIDLFVKPWANVYFRGKKIAEAPARGIRLPQGVHKLRLENPVTGQKKTVSVEVPASKPYRFTLTGGS